MSYQDAMLELLGGSYFPTEQPKRDVSQKEVKKEFELPEANENMRRAFSRLLSAEKNYLSAAEISLSASAVLISRTKNISAGEMFDKLKNSLKNQYKSYADKGKLSSKSSELEKLKKAVAFKLRRTAFHESEIKDISKTLFECADCALRCHTEQLLTEENTEELSEESSIALKM